MLRAKYNTVQRESVPAFSPLRRRRIIDIIRGNDVQSFSPDADLFKDSKRNSPQVRTRKVSADNIMRQFSHRQDSLAEPISPSRKNTTTAIKDIQNVQFKLPSISSRDRPAQKVGRYGEDNMVQYKFSYDNETDYEAQVSNYKKAQLKNVSTKQYQFSIRTKAGCNAKIMKINQDIDIINQKLPLGLKLFCVCDGHGTNGHLVAAFIRKKLQHHLKERLSGLRDLDGINDQIYLAMQKTNQELMQSDINTELSGATVVAIFIRNDKIICFNVGDSRAILINQDYEQLKAQQITFDQKPDRPDEAKRILAAGGRIQTQVNDRNQSIGPLRVWMKDIRSPGLAMTRSFGDKAGTRAGTNGEPQITQFMITHSTKYLLVASDGVWQHLENHEVVKNLQKQLRQQNLQEAADKLLKIASDQWDSKYHCRDDITFILVKLNSFAQST